jgi:UDP-sulfoquinovose synthase
VSKITGVNVDYLPNPRLEIAENDFSIENRKFLELGLNPTKLSEGLLEEVRDIALKYANRVDKSKIPPRSQWRTK